MSLGELVVIFAVALFAFGPNQLPMLTRHLARAARLITHYKDQLNQFWQQQLQSSQLLENEEKAAKADEAYQSSDKRSTNE